MDFPILSSVLHGREKCPIPFQNLGKHPINYSNVGSIIFAMPGNNVPYR